MTIITTAQVSLVDLAGSWAIDASHVRIGFVARHAMVTKVRGAFNEFQGSTVVDTDDFTKSTTTLTIKAAGIDTRNEQHDGHLRSNDFLAMDVYPDITFVSTGVTQTGATSLELTGDLTIKGVTRAVTVPFEFEGLATDPLGNLRAGFQASVSIKGLRHHLDRRARDRRHPGQRQDRARVRGLLDRERLTPG